MKNFVLLLPLLEFSIEDFAIFSSKLFCAFLLNLFTNSYMTKCCFCYLNYCKTEKVLYFFKTLKTIDQKNEIKSYQTALICVFQVIIKIKELL